MPSPPKHTPWHPLPLTTPVRGAPPLLLKSTFTQSTYTAHLTDLTNIWITTATKATILSHAEAEQTSIDPSETSQLTILLTKLRSALSAPADHIDVKLTSSPNSDLHVHTCTELQLPLKELVWTFKFTKLPSTAFTNLFTLPVLSVVSTLADQVESLLRTVKDKDGIIERLTDQLKEQGLEVRMLLGGGRARRRGLERFNVDAWRGEYSQEGDKRVAEVVKEVFGGEEGRCEEAPGVRGLGEVEGWWKAVEGGEEEDGDEEEEEVKPEEKGEEKVRSLTREVSPMRISPNRKGGGEGKSPVKKAKKSVDTDDEDDEFEVQKVPPSRPFHPFTLKEPSPPPVPIPLADDTASDSDSLDLPPPRKFIPSAAPKSPTTKPKPKIGKIGGTRKKTERQESLSPPPLLAKSRDVNMLDTAAVEEAEDSDTVVVPGVRDKGKMKAGALAVKTVIGGEKAVADDTDDTDEVKEVRPVGMKKTIGKIGKIGKIGGRKVVKVEEDIDVGSRSSKVGGTMSVSDSERELDCEQVRVESLSPLPLPVKVKVRTPTPEPEDEDEKADRKRRQLEKELEAKKKAPAKKKRKF